MTREEAWQGLEGYALLIADGTELKEAISMAIEALKKETGCDGCRQLQIHCFECARRKQDYYKGASE